MASKFFDFDSLSCDVNYRFLQPPQIAYFVTTIDKYGNENVTPVTLGTLVAAQLPRGNKPSEYYFTFSLGCTDLRDEGNVTEKRHGFKNLNEVKECVISYIGYDLMYESTVTGLPIPRGISEIDVAGLTKLPSKKVKPCGIKECAVNMEAVIESSTRIGTYYELYVCKIVGISVDEEYIKSDDRGYGIYQIDPLFEIYIGREKEDDDARLYYGRMDPEKIHITDYGIGCKGDWIGTFDKWMRSEIIRGRITQEEYQEIIKLNKKWQDNRDPEGNKDVKKELTDRLARICKR